MRRAAPVLALLALTGCQAKTLGAVAYVSAELWPISGCVVFAAMIPAAIVADLIVRRRVGYKA